jgi:hypothetical protein
MRGVEVAALALVLKDLTDILVLPSRHEVLVGRSKP